ncbi:D-alanine--D-alanine ligase [Mariprofundus ferrooxydans]|uniref:D-alanine--D-alanine ligase n=1 Tax=Mariprofundus ferrooxydans PV-1 TaxID=314345 RepID=Q0EYH7_9PROT|nr:D-alanine--D-alanine ligase [Mariprofundus ferrooxydans]EAU54390.1 D-alanine--D-alanine ligase [Mariprofundus ferrooxydans PV-1]KON47394.1 D-alanine--D-alanine ligase [Mariprofundus ferrooxydans]
MVVSGINMQRFGRTGVLMGGTSAEREVSLRSGAAVLDALRAAGVDAVGIDLQQNWADQIAKAAIDTAFIALHGTLGEDGCVQGLLEIMGIPYTGSHVMASALCMNKRLCKQVLGQAGLSTPMDIRIEVTGPERYPVFVKPVAEGSSVGLHRISSQQEWQALNIQSPAAWMAEMPVNGVEIAVSVLAGVALMPVEVAPKSGVYDYASKYTVGATEYFCPARLPMETVRYCMDCAEKAVAACGCTGAPRVDMIVGSGGEAVILEINTLPGMTATSLLPKAAAVAGIDFQTLCLRILETASLEYGQGVSK